MKTHILHLENMEPLQASILYRYLLHGLKSGLTDGLIGDRNHPAYVAGADGEDDINGLGDSPAHNELYQMMAALAKALPDDGEIAEADLVRDWQTFCRIVTSHHRQEK